MDGLWASLRKFLHLPQPTGDPGSTGDRPGVETQLPGSTGLTPEGGDGEDVGTTVRQDVGSGDSGKNADQTHFSRLSVGDSVTRCDKTAHCDPNGSCKTTEHSDLLCNERETNKNTSCTSTSVTSAQYVKNDLVNETTDSSTSPIQHCDNLSSDILSLDKNSSGGKIKYSPEGEAKVTGSVRFSVPPLSESALSLPPQPPAFLNIIFHPLQTCVSIFIDIFRFWNFSLDHKNYKLYSIMPFCNASFG